jgi:ribosomal protein L40E
LKLLDGGAPSRTDQPENGYLLKVISNNGETLYSFRFSVENQIVLVPPEDIFDQNSNQIKMPEPNVPISNPTTLNLVVPYFENGKTIEIFDPTGKLSLSIDVSQYMKAKSTSRLQLDSLTKSGAILLMIGIGFVIVLAIIAFFIYSYLRKKKVSEKTHGDKEKQGVLKCEKCHALLKPHAKFCKKCGHRAKIKHEKGVCPECGTKNEPDAKFCEKCGTVL